MGYLFGDTQAENTAAIKFFHRWLSLQLMGWQRQRSLGVLKDDPDISETWRAFAAEGYGLLTSEEVLRQPDKQEYLRGDRVAVLHDLFESSPLLSPYVREVLMDGNINDALSTLVRVYEFEQRLPVEVSAQAPDLRGEEIEVGGTSGSDERGTTVTEG